MRLPGTCSRYSKNAMPQLATAATYHGRAAMFLRWAYQANVMKTLEPTSSSVAETTGLMCNPSGGHTARVAQASVDGHHGGPGEEIEIRGTCPGVSAHRSANHQIALLQLRQHEVLGDHVDTVAGGPGEHGG